jgi:hypothetical protein
MFAQQAIFTSCRTSRLDGYQLVATSPGVTQSQADELSAWGPAHDSLLHPTVRAGSVNFHRLADGTWCISKTLPAGAEYSGRSGPRIYTTCLLADGDLLDRFSNQPFRLLDAVLAAGHFRVLTRIAETLPVIALRGRAAPLLLPLVEPLSDDATRLRVLALMDAALDGHNLLVRSRENLRVLLDRMLNVLPLEVRSELSFSTGLVSSPQRPFRLLPAPLDSLDSRHSARRSDAVVFDVDAAAERAAALKHPWVQSIDELLRAGRPEELLERLTGAVGCGSRLGGQ